MCAIGGDFMIHRARVAHVRAALAISLPALALAEGKPQAPQVTVGSEIRQLRFDWEPAKRVAYYQVWYKADAQSDYVRVGAPLPANRTHARVSVAAHLLDWVNA